MEAHKFTIKYFKKKKKQPKKKFLNLNYFYTYCIIDIFYKNIYIYI